MFEFLLTVCLTYNCYISDDNLVVQMPIEAQTDELVHPDDTVRFRYKNITIVSVPVEQGA